MFDRASHKGKITENPRLSEIFAPYVGVPIPTHITGRTNKWSTRVYQETEPTDEGYALLQELVKTAKANGINDLRLSTPDSLSLCDKKPGRLTLYIKEENDRWVLQDECTFG